MRIDGKAPVADVEHDTVAAGGVRRWFLARLANLEIPVAVECGHDGAVGHGEDGLTKGGETGWKRGITNAGAVLGVQLVEVDRETLAQVPMTVDRLHRAAVRSVATTPERGPVRSGQWGTEHDWWPPIDVHRRSGVGQVDFG